ncbi:SDR family NAD(P)-dependent oxidoreductase [Rhizobium sp. 2YAF20]|uniref:SDR family NAD(P)-dependent oxidoreductase n=1 Tax=Rhizobium sp. 2YAF20 TaxID=3233027 RepID=UPI003F973104
MLNDRDRIIVSATACRFADAATSDALWSNALEGRRSFRPIPRRRLDISAYDAKVAGEADSITPIMAGLITNWSFDCQRFRIPKRTFASTDLSHWLALELASDVMEAIGGAQALPKERTAVIVANTLTGEFSRATSMRLRLPFFDAVLAQALREAEVDERACHSTRQRFIQLMRDRLEQPTEETLAGSLANTIAGRIANFFDFRGGGYSVDGACSSSLVAVSSAATLIESGQADFVVVCAVDLSLDPFELVGFSRNGALARRRMRVFDRNSDGFWPGEGGAVVLLARAETAARYDIPVRAILSGWGMSTDGAGGLTRPTVEGQLLACKRAYEKAALDPRAVAYIEAHGTGTAIGDSVEIAALAQLREDAKDPLPIGSIKANIGHTKAAAGMAGLIKAIASLETGLLAPHVGCETPHPSFHETGDKVFPILVPTRMNGRLPIVGVSSFGFGGINVHLVLEPAASISGAHHNCFPPRARDCEVFLFSAADRETLRRGLVACEAVADHLSLSEMEDLAGKFAHEKDGSHPWRLGFAACSPTELRRKTQQAISAVDALATGSVNGIHFSINSPAARIGFMFPGQAAPVRPIAGIWAKRFPELILREHHLTIRDGNTDTANAQLAIIQTSLTAVRLLEALGVKASVGAGHSVGELSALAWGGVLSDPEAISLAAKRGHAMGRHGQLGGGMVRLQGDHDRIAAIAIAYECDVACRNGAGEFVLAGPAESIAAVIDQARQCGFEPYRLNVSHAFHSHAMDLASQVFTKLLNDVPLHEPAGTVLSSVSGSRVGSASEARVLLADQLTHPVLFDAVLQSMKEHADFVVEVGPSAGLSRLASSVGLMSASIDAFGETLVPFMETLSALHISRCDINADALYPRDSLRVIDLNSHPTFLSNPCGFETQSVAEAYEENMVVSLAPSIDPVGLENLSVLDVVRDCVARETGLNRNSVSPDSKFLNDLHLNSLTVSRIAVAAARACGLAGLSNPTEFANATPDILALAIREIMEFPTDVARQRVEGAGRWVAAYSMVFEAVEPPVSYPADMDPSNRNECDYHILRISSPFDTGAAVDFVRALQRAVLEKVTRIAILHAGAPISGFCRSIVEEQFFETFVLMDVGSAPADDPRIMNALRQVPRGLTEFRLTACDLEIAVFRPSTLTSSHPPIPCSDEVILAIGCAKGIGFDCVAASAVTGQAIVLVGRSTEEDREVQATLENAVRLGLRCQYMQADVTEIKDVIALKQRLQHAGLLPTTLLFAPAINEPTPFLEIHSDRLNVTLAPKVCGLRHVLESFGGDLSSVVAFGSIIARVGLEGEAHYALANAMQSDLLEKFAAATPNCKCLSIEWTVWGAGGMGERLGTIERLQARGVDPISTSDARRVFCYMLEHGVSGTICVTSRFGAPSRSLIGSSDIPFLRFVDDLLVDYPGVEIVSETKVSHGSDPYLADHVIDGRPVFPGVMALEAMGQVTSCLTGSGRLTNASSVMFMRAISVPFGSSTLMRIAACRQWSGDVRAAIFADDDGFSVPFATAIFQSDLELYAPAPPTVEAVPPAVGDCYGPLFFGAGRFQRIASLNTLSSRLVTGSLRNDKEDSWFGSFHHQALAFWDPGSADALLHALQATVPTQRVVPTGIGGLYVLSSMPVASLVARENWAHGNEFCFDIWGLGASGEVVVHFGDARFHAIAPHEWRTAVDSQPALLGPVIERIARNQKVGGALSASLLYDPNMDRNQRRKRVLERLGIDYEIGHGGDGRPLLQLGDGHVGLAHCQHMTVAIRSTVPVACDVEAFHHFEGDGTAEKALRWTTNEVARKLDQGLAIEGSPIDGQFRPKCGSGESAFQLRFSIHGEQYWLAVGVTASRETDRITTNR